MASEADPDWEVATVKASDPNETRGQHVNFQGRRIELLDTTAEQLLLLGYGVQKSQLAGELEWVKTAKWDINGVPDRDGRPSWTQLQGLIRKVLAERFGLRLHREQREMSVFALLAAKDGPKVTPDESDPDGWMHQENRESGGRHTENLTNASMRDVASILQFHVDRPVVDQTGLKGRYDLNLQWAVNGTEPSLPDTSPNLFTALQEQAGLKLERVKAPADVLVLDGIEKPGEN